MWIEMSVQVEIITWEDDREKTSSRYEDQLVNTGAVHQILKRDEDHCLLRYKNGDRDIVRHSYEIMTRIMGASHAKDF